MQTMADSHPNIHIGSGHQCANANTATRFNSPITFVQLGIWILMAAIAMASLYALPRNEKFTPVATDQPAKSVSQIKTGTIKPAKPAVSSTGITILSRSRFDTAAPGKPSTAAPVAAGADSANGFAITLGKAKAFSTLSARFERVANMNAAIFQNLEPRATFIETSSGLEAQLLAGPFASMKDAEIMCGILHLPGGIICKTQAFGGDLISRQ